MYIKLERVLEKLVAFECDSFQASENLRNLYKLFSRMTTTVFSLGNEILTAILIFRTDRKERAYALPPIEGSDSQGATVSCNRECR